MVWVGKELKIIQFQPLAMDRDIFHLTRVLRASSNLAQNNHPEQRCRHGVGLLTQFVALAGMNHRLRTKPHFGYHLLS